MAQVDTVSFGKAFSQILKEKKISQKNLASEINRSNVVINRMANDVQSPTLDNAIKALKPLGYTLAVVEESADLPESSFLLHEKD